MLFNISYYDIFESEITNKNYLYFNDELLFYIFIDAITIPTTYLLFIYKDNMHIIVVL